MAEDVVLIPVFLSQEATSHINDNYLICPTLSKPVVARLDERSVAGTVKPEVVDSSVLDLHKSQMTSSLYPQSVSYLVVNHVHSVCFHSQPQKKGISPFVQKIEIKDVKGVSCASQCLSAPNVPNVPSVVPSLAVGGRLQKFWQVWLTLGANPRVVWILREGYTLPFKIQPPLTRSPVIKSGHAHPVKSKALFEALVELINKLVVEKVVIRSSPAFYNRLFRVPKPNNRWRPILDLSQLNLFLKPGTFKMETPETVRLSLQKGEWVTSLDFSDTYSHIPINQRSRKYLRFYLGKKAYPFTALPFGLATAPLEFTKVVKEVKLMAQARGIRIHQYLDDWLVRAPCQETCRLHTQTLLALCHGKSELTPQQVFNFVGYRFNLLSGWVLPTQDRWVTLQQKLQFIKGRKSCSVRQFMSLKTGMGRSPPHETRSVAPEATLACTRESGKYYSNSPLSLSTPRLVVRRRQCTQGSTFAPPSTRSANIYRRLKRRLGRTLRGIHGKRHLVRTRKSSPHQFLGAQSSYAGPQEFRALLQGTDCSDSNGQHNCSLLHQQGGRYEIRLSLCPPLETPVLVSSQENSSASAAHSRSLECHSRQTVQTQSSDTDRVVPVSTGFPSLVFQMGPASDRPFCNSVQSQAPQVCISGSGSGSLGSGCSQSCMGKSGCVCLPSSLPPQSSGVQAHGSRLSQDDPDRPRMAKHALVLGSGQSVKSVSH